MDFHKSCLFKFIPRLQKTFPTSVHQNSLKCVTDEKVNSIDGKISTIERSIDNIDGKINKIDDRINKVESRVSDLKGQVDKIPIVKE